MNEALLHVTEPSVRLPVAVVADDVAWLDSLVELLRAADLPAIGFGIFDGLPPLGADGIGFGCLVVGMQARRTPLGLGLLRGRIAGEASLPGMLLVPGPIEPALALAALRAGVWELVDAAGSEARLPDLVHRALAGTPPDGIRADPALPDAAASLQPDERRLLELLLAGRSRRSIGRRFGIEHSMIDSRWIAAGRRLGASSHLGALRAAMRAGIRAA